MKKPLIALAAAALATAAFAQAVLLPTVEGEVRKVDLDTQKITLKHGDIPNIDMTAMTMVFRVKDPALLHKVKAGDKVKFTADKVEGAVTVMSLEVEREASRRQFGLAGSRWYSGRGASRTGWVALMHVFSRLFSDVPLDSSNVGRRRERSAVNVIRSGTSNQSEI